LDFIEFSVNDVILCSCMMFDGCEECEISIFFCIINVEFMTYLCMEFWYAKEMKYKVLNEIV